MLRRALRATGAWFVRCGRAGGMDFFVPALAIVAAYVACVLETGFRQSFGARFIFAWVAIGVTLAVLALLPVLLRRWPGSTSVVVLGMFVAFVAVSASLSPLGAGWGIFLASIGPLVAVVAYVSLADLLTGRRTSAS